VQSHPKRSASQATGRILWIAVIVVLAVLTACGTQRNPTSYTGSVQKNFIRSCQQQSKKDSVSGAQAICACSYKEIKKTIKFSRFKKINSDLTAKPQALPSDMVKIVEGCSSNSGQ